MEEILNSILTHKGGLPPYAKSDLIPEDYVIDPQKLASFLATLKAEVEELKKEKQVLLNYIAQLEVEAKFADPGWAGLRKP